MNGVAFHDEDEVARFFSNENLSWGNMVAK